MPFLVFLRHSRPENSSSNELNASYAADGYARIKEGTLGVITTTYVIDYLHPSRSFKTHAFITRFGVGELSAINGIAGAYSEMVPILHIAGVPSTVQLKSKPLLHHTLGDGRFDVYQHAVSPFVVHQAHILNKLEAAAQIDFAITECITKVSIALLLLLNLALISLIGTSRVLNIAYGYRPPRNIGGTPEHPPNVHRPTQRSSHRSIRHRPDPRARQGGRRRRCRSCRCLCYPPWRA